MSDNVPVWVSKLRINLKKIIKILLSVGGWMYRRLFPLKSVIRILFYHRINDLSFSDLGAVSREITVSPEMFEKQLAYLKSQGYRSLLIDELQGILAGDVKPDPKAVMITFDDGYKDNLTTAAPLLEKYGFSALVFIIPELLGSETGYCWRYGDPEGSGQFLTWEDVLQLHQQGWMIGSHSLTHPLLTKISEQQLAAELNDSRNMLEEKLEESVMIFAYPGGDFDDNVLKKTHQAGYSVAMTTIPGVTSDVSDPYALCRTEVSASDNLFLFRMKMQGTLDWTAIKEALWVRRMIAGMTDAIVWVFKPGMRK